MINFDAKILSETLKVLRERKGLKQSELADKVSIGRHSISFYETGKSLPPIDVLLRICNALESDLDTIVFGFENKAKNDSHGELKSKHNMEMLDMCQREKNMLKEFLDSLDRKNEELSSELEKVKLELQQYKSKRS